MTDWKRVFEIADDMKEAFSLYDRYHNTRDDMSYFYAADVPRQFDSRTAGGVLQRLQVPTSNFKRLIDEQVRKATPTARNRLPVNDRVFLWLHVPSCRDIIKFEDLPEAAQSFIYIRDEKLFAEKYDPNTSSTKLNRNILKDIDNRKVYGVFFKKIDDEHLADLMHKYPIDMMDALRSSRLHRRGGKLMNRMITVFDCSKVRNQSHLRTFICAFPWIMTNQTLDMMEASPINRDTWARLIGELKVEQRQYFPAGTGPWARRGIFVKHLKGKNSKPFKDFETGLPVDTSGEDAVKCKHEHDLSTDDTFVETP